MVTKGSSRLPFVFWLASATPTKTRERCVLPPSSVNQERNAITGFFLCAKKNLPHITGGFQQFAGIGITPILQFVVVGETITIEQEKSAAVYSPHTFRATEFSFDFTVNFQQLLVWLSKRRWSGDGVHFLFRARIFLAFGQASFSARNKRPRPQLPIVPLCKLIFASCFRVLGNGTITVPAPAVLRLPLAV